MADVEEITLLLRRAEAGGEDALDDLMNAVYADLERMARAYLRRQFGARAGSITLEPAAVVNESFMMLIRQRAKYDNRGHFFSIATKMMFRVMSEYRRRKGALKRGGDAHVTLVFDDQLVADAGDQERTQIDLDALMAGLESLERVDPRKADVVKLRVVWGLTNDEIAAALELSRPTIEREWRFAKAWLAEAVASSGPLPGATGDGPTDEAPVV